MNIKNIVTKWSVIGVCTGNHLGRERICYPNRLLAEEESTVSKWCY